MLIQRFCCFVPHGNFSWLELVWLATYIIPSQLSTCELQTHPCQSYYRVNFTGKEINTYKTNLLHCSLISLSIRRDNIDCVLKGKLNHNEFIWIPLRYFCRNTITCLQKYFKKDLLYNCFELYCRSLYRPSNFFSLVFLEWFLSV